MYGHGHGNGRQKPHTAKSLAKTEELARKIWAQIHAEQQEEELANTFAPLCGPLDAYVVFTQEEE